MFQNSKPILLKFFIFDFYGGVGGCQLLLISHGQALFYNKSWKRWNVIISEGCCSGKMCVYEIQLLGRP